MEDGEEGTLESIYSSHFVVEETGPEQESEMSTVTLLLGIRAQCGRIHITIHPVRLARSHTAACTTHTHSYAHSHPQMQVLSPGLLSYTL